MNYILVGKNGRASMLGVLGLLQSDCSLIVKRQGLLHQYTKGSEKVKVLPKLPAINEGDILIRWGNSIEIPIKAGLIYNQARAIALSSDKKKSRLALHNSGVAVPTTWATIENFLADKNKLGPFIVRPMKHKQGKQFVVATTDDEVEEAFIDFGQGSYISQLYPKTREFRAHVAHGKILAIHEKPAPEDKSIIAWNMHQNHNAFQTIKWSDYDRGICKLALAAASQLELDFAAVDILAFPTDEKAFPRAVVCEVNTAPMLKEQTQAKYAAYFDWLFRKGQRREHWKTDKFEKASSYAWKNFQLADKKDE